MSETAPRPTMPGERIIALDVIRGFAMFGVLVAFCAWSLGTIPPESFTPFDRALDTTLGFLVDNKFYTLLAFLFGLGFQLQLDRGGNSGESARLYRRRLLGLAAIGLVHAALLRNGDILLPYAAAGFLLIPFRHASDRALVTAALLVLLLWPLAAKGIWQAAGLPTADRPDTENQAFYASNFAWLRYWYATAPLNWPLNLSLFLLGLVAGRRRLVGRLEEAPRLARRIALAGVAGGLLFYFARLALTGAALPAEAAHEAARLLFTFHAWSLAAAYAALLLLAQRSRRGERALQPLAAVGRMALTNYLLQAGLIVPFCLLFGLFDRFTPSSALLLALAVFALQVPFSLLWLRRFEFGPAEWLWRRLTYGRVPSARRSAAAEAPL